VVEPKEVNIVSKVMEVVENCNFTLSSNTGFRQALPQRARRRMIRYIVVFFIR
jgi:hypothetical protein